MSVGNLKDSGNQGNNFPYQLAVLRGLSISQMKNLEEVYFEETSGDMLATVINNYFIANTNKFLVSKSVVYDGTYFIGLVTVGNI
jgi:hypothetical protein